jgi:hypothetical protein
MRLSLALRLTRQAVDLSGRLVAANPVKGHGPSRRPAALRAPRRGVTPVSRPSGSGEGEHSPVRAAVREPPFARTPKGRRSGDRPPYLQRTCARSRLVRRFAPQRSSWEGDTVSSPDSRAGRFHELHPRFQGSTVAREPRLEDPPGSVGIPGLASTPPHHKRKAGASAEVEREAFLGREHSRDGAANSP